MADIHVSNACLSWDNQTIFQDLKLSLCAGHWTCVLGQSGVGKSTLVRLLAGITPQDATLSAEIICTDQQPLTGRVAWMAQQDLLLPWLSVLNNILLGPRLRQHRRVSQEQRDRARSLLDEVGLSDFAEAFPSTLSGGQRQRVALARTLMEDHLLICMDEPFSALDAINRIKLQDLSYRLLQDRTVLMITHDPLEALRLADQVLVLKGQPASFSTPIYPQGQAPRAVDQEALLKLQGVLLRQLAENGSG